MFQNATKQEYCDKDLIHLFEVHHTALGSGERLVRTYRVGAF